MKSEKYITKKQFYSELFMIALIVSLVSFALFVVVFRAIDVADNKKVDMIENKNNELENKLNIMKKNINGELNKIRDIISSDMKIIKGC